MNDKPQDPQKPSPMSTQSREAETELPKPDSPAAQMTLPAPERTTDQTPTPDSYQSSTQHAGSFSGEASLSVLAYGTRYDNPEEFARGGLGRILKAKDKRLERPVAIKELLRNKGTAEMRFVREAMITAKLEHPAIVPVHDAGRWPSGAPFFTMKMINGRSLKEVLDEAKTLQDRLALLPHLIDTCEAMAYAHSQKIIHRDLKPQNILVGAFGETVVIDWGLAKELGSAEEAESNDEEKSAERDSASSEAQPYSPFPTPSANDLTRVGAVMGTPAFMPPEQARGESVDERADVYALGAILYYFLTGTPPYRGVSGKDIVRQVLEGPPHPVIDVQPDAPKDLIAITAKAMARDLNFRYRTAKELAEDLRKYQVGGLVGVYKYSSSELLRRWLQKNRAAVTVASVLLLFILVAGSYSIASIIQARNEAQAAQAQERGLREEAEKQRALAQLKQKEAEESSNQLRLLQARSYLDSDPAATLAWMQGLSADASGWSYARLMAQETQRRGASRYVFRGHKALVNEMVFSPDGKLLASASKDGTVRLWDIEARKDYPLRVSQKESMTPPGVTATAFSPDGSLLAAADSDGTVCLWRRDDVLQGNTTGKALEGHTSQVSALAFSPDGKMLATASDDTMISLWTVADGARKIFAGQLSPVKSVAFRADGAQLASLGQDGSVMVWDVASQASTRLLGKADPLVGLRYASEGKRLLGVDEGAVIVWSTATPEAEPGRLTPSYTGFTIRVMEASSEYIAVAGTNGDVLLWSFSEEKWRTFHGGTANFGALRFSPDQKTLAGASSDRLVWLWNVKDGTSHALKGHLGGVHTLTFSPDGKTLASVCDYNAVRLWSIESGAELGTSLLLGHEAEVTGMVVSKDGKTLYSIDRKGGVWKWSLDEEGGSVFTRSTINLLTVALSPDGKYLAFAGEDPSIRVIDTTTGKLTQLKGDAQVTRALAFSPDSKTLVSGGDDDAVRRWDLASGDGDSISKNSEIIVWYKGGIYSLAFSPDGKILAVGGGDRLIHLMQLGEAKVTHLSSHLDTVTALSFSSDGAYLASGSKDKGIRVFKVASVLQGETKAEAALEGHGGQVNVVAFSPDGTQLLSGGDDRTTRLWDIQSVQNIVIDATYTQGKGAAFTPSGDRILSSTEQNAIILWQHPLLPTAPAELKAWLSQATTAKVGKDYKLRSNQ